MAHTSIVPNDQDRYYAGDALDIVFQFEDEHDGTAIDLTAMTVEFRLKEDITDADADAVLTKTGTEGGTTSGVTFTDPLNGEAVVNVATDDTATVVNDGSGSRLESVVMDWHIRVIDTDSNRVTSEIGDWEIFAS